MMTSAGSASDYSNSPNHENRGQRPVASVALLPVALLMFLHNGLGVPCWSNTRRTVWLIGDMIAPLLRPLQGEGVCAAR